MKIAFLSDIHSNHHALEVCFDYIEKNNIDITVFMGDYVSDFPYPMKTLEMIRQFSLCYKSYFIKGNREEYLFDSLKNKTAFQKGSQQGSLLYTFENMTKEAITELNKLPIYLEIDTGECPLFSVSHSGIDNSRVLYYIDDGTARGFLLNQPYTLHALGHSHRRFILEEKGKVLINPGSVGVPIDTKGCTQMATAEYKDNKFIPELITLPFDYEAAIREFYDSGLYDYSNVWSRTMIAILKTGIHYNSQCVSLVKQMSKETGLPFSCEELWQKAARILKI